MDNGLVLADARFRKISESITSERMRGARGDSRKHPAHEKVHPIICYVKAKIRSSPMIHVCLGIFPNSVLTDKIQERIGLALARCVVQWRWLSG